MAFGRQLILKCGERDRESLEIDKLRITAHIETQLGSSNNGTAEITVYGVNDNTANILTRAGNHIILSAGYADEVVSTIFVGDIVKGTRGKEGHVPLVDIDCADSYTEVQSTSVSISYEADISAATVVQGICDYLGLPVKGLDLITSDLTFSSGYSYCGLAVDALTAVLSDVDLHWTIQGGQLVIYSDEMNIDDVGLDLALDSGLITHPMTVSDNGDSDNLEQPAKTQWTFKTLLFPQLLPGKTVQITDPGYFEGRLYIQEVVFEADNFEGEFTATVTGTGE